jgi:A/G-specific adenine glycosylase
VKRGAAFVARDSAGAVLLERRPEKGLLGGMLQPPLGPWAANFPNNAQVLRQAPFRAAWSRNDDVVRHVFTHFELELLVYSADVSVRPSSSGFWLDTRELTSAALPTVMRKVLERAGLTFQAKSARSR